jgi:predicted Rossmann fold flavoprotein
VKTDIAIIGGGAAGFMAAIFAARGASAAPRPAKVVLLERTTDGGRKILISGGGRCNVLPSRFDPSQYFTDSSPNILRNILRSWPDRAQRDFFENDLGLRLELEDETGKLFPASHRARDVRDALVRAARDAGAEIRFDCTVRAVEGAANGWTVVTSDGTIEARNVIIAAGGLSVPKTGSDGIGFRIARALGHTVHETYAALTPLVCATSEMNGLAGVSFPVTLRVPGQRKTTSVRGGFLFTHNGYSGPSVLDVSHYAVRALEHGAQQPIHAQWTERSRDEIDQLLRRGNATVFNTLHGVVPERLLTRLLALCDVAPSRIIPQLRRDERARLVDALTDFALPYTGHEGYRKAEVTGGGVALDEIDARTMQSRLHSGLYFCGEVLDAFGPIGGYNFAWAWATGRLAGMAAAAAAASAASAAASAGAALPDTE